MSNENAKTGSRRPYQLKARARRQEEVHRRITAAAVQLHGTVGPARTTMQAIAEIAGVRRATVYNHFPTEFELVDACSSHWFKENPPPDPAGWLDVSDLSERVRRALLAMYSYYERGEPMLEKVLRDAHLVPALAEITRQKWEPLLAGVVETLMPARPSGAKTPAHLTHKQLRATLRVALDFFTWQQLKEGGLSLKEAVSTAHAWIGAEGRRRR